MSTSSKGLRVDGETWEALRALAYAEKATMTAVVRRLALGERGSVAEKNRSEGVGAGGRRAGRSRLVGRPLDEDGSIALRVERTPDPFPGLPEAMETSEDFPMTSRPDYVGIPRVPQGPTSVGPFKKGSEDWWAQACQRRLCGHTRRVHQTGDGKVGRCQQCLSACHGFLETAIEVPVDAAF